MHHLLLTKLKKISISENSKNLKKKCNVSSRPITDFWEKLDQEIFYEKSIIEYGKNIFITFPVPS